MIEEDVEVIKVERRSDDEDDIVSEVSEGGGWLETGDERNKLRALQKKTLWKIVESERKE